MGKENRCIQLRFSRINNKTKQNKDTHAAQESIDTQANTRYQKRRRELRRTRSVVVLRIKICQYLYSGDAFVFRKLGFWFYRAYDIGLVGCLIKYMAHVGTVHWDNKKIGKILPYRE